MSHQSKPPRLWEMDAVTELVKGIPGYWVENKQHSASVCNLKLHIASTLSPPGNDPETEITFTVERLLKGWHTKN